MCSIFFGDQHLPEHRNPHRLWGMQDLKEADQLVAKQKTLIATSLKSIKKLNSELQKKERELEGFLADLQALLEGREGTGEEVEELRKQQHELQAEIKEVKAELDAKRGEVRHPSRELLAVSAMIAPIGDEAVSSRHRAVICCKQGLPYYFPARPDLRMIPSLGVSLHVICSGSLQFHSDVCAQ